MAIDAWSRRPLDWLKGTDSDQQRFQEMHERFRDAWIFGVLIAGCTVLAAATYGWWLVLLPCFASVVMGVGLNAHRFCSQPEVVATVTFALLELDLGVTVLLTGGGASPLLSLMMVPIFTQAVAFRPQVTVAWVSFSALLTLGAIAAATTIDDVPEASTLLQATSYLVLLGCLALAAHYLATSDVRSRDEAAQDPLTGLFNRKALESRFQQATSRLRASGEPLALLIVDVDHFKRINDSHGHRHGDLVLRQLAQRLLANVRPEDLVFRIGGEEFLILMAGLDHESARFAADRLNKAVSEHPIGGLRVTVSVGVADGRGESLQYGAMAEAADAALYRAKRDGRDCVRFAA